VYNNQLSYMKY